LHTRDAASAGTTDSSRWALPPYLVAAAFTCVVSQRLVRRLCPHLSQAEDRARASTWEKSGIGEAPRRQMKIHDAAGCKRCFGTGYLGRVGIYEVLAMDEEMADMIERGVPVRSSAGRSRLAASNPCAKTA